MPDPIPSGGTPPAPENNGENQTPPAAPGGTEPPKKPEGGGDKGGFDTSKIGDDDFQKIFDDPRLWKHPRFSTLNERAKKADEYEKQAEADKTKKLEEEKKFQELADLEKKKREAAEVKYQTAQIDNRIQSEAAKSGVVDLEAVLKLIDRTNLKVDESGTVTGVEDAVKALLEAKPYLKGKPGAITVGAPTSPGQGTETTQTFTLSQIQDPVFFRANEEAIKAALKAGTVEDDLHQGQA